MARLHIISQKTAANPAFYIELQGLNAQEMVTAQAAFEMASNLQGSLMLNPPQHEADGAIAGWLPDASATLTLIGQLRADGIEPENKASIAQSMRWLKRSQQQLSV